MRLYSLVLSTLAATLLLSGCAPVTGSVPPDLANTRWLVEDLEGRGVIDRVQSTLEFGERGAVAGNLACNRFTTSYEQSGPGLRFGLVAATRRMCPEAVMDQEQRFNAVLGNTRGALVKEPYLYLIDERGATIARLIRHVPEEAGERTADPG
ncbi:MAG: META domain-containing protein [Steroidobacteraceae bacterium]|jgi:heat shock protein HslJ|nr:META domain-containing protein [Steroidobacteraceae bacterium]